MNSPIDLINKWLHEEHAAGAPNPQQAVLSTSTNDNTPHGRVVAIREINDQGLLFFTQKGTRKVNELNKNPIAAITFWFELLQREIMIEGTVTPLSMTENDRYWRQYPREAQIRFCAYASTSAQPITSKHTLEDKKKKIEHDYRGKEILASPFYLGFRLKPNRVVFYAYRTDELSDVEEYKHGNDEWKIQILSP